MTANMGTLDRVVCTIVALVIAALYYTGKITGTVSRHRTPSCHPLPR